MVVEELQILIGCDASTAEKILTSLEERLARFMKQAGAAFSDTKTIRAQGAAEREALKTEAARAKYAAQIEKSNASILQTKQRMEQAEQSEETYMNTREVKQLLKVCDGTLNLWAKRGYLVPIKVGNKNMYAKSDIRRVQTGNKCESVASYLKRKKK